MVTKVLSAKWDDVTFRSFCELVSKIEEDQLILEETQICFNQLMVKVKLPADKDVTHMLVLGKNLRDGGMKMVCSSNNSQDHKGFDLDLDVYVLASKMHGKPNELITIDVKELDFAEEVL